MFCSWFFPLILSLSRCLNSIYFKYKDSTELDYFQCKYIIKIKKNCNKQIFSRHLDFENITLLLRKLKKNQRVNHLFFIATAPFCVDVISSELSGNGNSIWIVSSIISFHLYLNGHSITLYAHYKCDNKSKPYRLLRKFFVTLRRCDSEHLT